MGYTLQAGDPRPPLYSGDTWCFDTGDNGSDYDAIQIDHHGRWHVGKSLADLFSQQDGFWTEVYTDNFPRTYFEVASSYNMTFVENTQCDILLIDDTNYKYIWTQSLNGNYVVKADKFESSMIKSNFILTTENSLPTSGGVLSNITGTNVLYTKKVIIRYKHSNTTSNTITKTYRPTGILSQSKRNITGNYNWIINKDGITK